MPKKRTRAGNSKAQAAHRRALFVEKYCENGGNGRQAFKDAGFSTKQSTKSLDAEVYRLLHRPAIAQAIAKRRAETLAVAQEHTQLTGDEMLRSLARDIRFDPAKMLDEKGNLKPIADMDEDTRLALRGMEHYAEFSGTGEDRAQVGMTTKVKFPEKTAAREQGMKHFGLYEADNRQKPELQVNVLAVTVSLESEKVLQRALLGLKRAA